MIAVGFYEAIAAATIGCIIGVLIVALCCKYFLNPVIDWLMKDPY
jgi:hypothetical protein